jgi:hypothetical protein
LPDTLEMALFHLNIISLMSYGLRTVRKILAVNQFTRSRSNLETDNRP